MGMSEWYVWEVVAYARARYGVVVAARAVDFEIVDFMYVEDVFVVEIGCCVFL